MDNIARDIIETSVKAILDAMGAGVFTKEDMEFLKKLFEKALQITEKTLRGKK